jgi:hypothetical protein
METQKKILLSLIAGLLVVSLLSFALADDNESINKTIKNNTEIRQAVKNATMNYGQCVSEAAKMKNDCFAELRNQTVSCKPEPNANRTGKMERNKTALRDCKSSLKTGEVQCKAAFKASKIECAKIKHTFFEGLRASFA